MLAWELEWGSQYQTLLEIEEATGEAPPALQRRPRLPPELSFYLVAFYVLSRSRPIAGMGSPGAIPLSEMVAFFHLYQIPAREHPWWVSLMSRLDGVFLEHEAKKQEARISSQKKDASS